MKKLALIILLALSLNSFGQSSGSADTTKMQSNFYWPGWKYPSLYSWRLLLPPQDTVFTKYGLAQKGVILGVGNGSYFSKLLNNDTTFYQANGFKLTNNSQIRVGQAYPFASLYTKNTEPPFSIGVNDSIVNSSATTIAGINIQSRATFTNSSYAGNFVGIRNIPMISASNTQNWTGNARHPNLAAYYAVPMIDITSQTFTVSSMTAFIGALQNWGDNVTVSNMYYFATEKGVNTGTVTNAAGISLDTMNIATNNTYISLGTRDIAAGNWWLYNKNAYNGYYGTGRHLYNTTTDNGTDIIQAKGTVLVGNGTPQSGYAFQTAHDFGALSSSSRVGYFYGVAAQTVSSFGSGFQAGVFLPEIGATNTQDWTFTNKAGLEGLITAPRILAGATGTISRVISARHTFTNSGMTTTQYVGGYYQDPEGTATITNAVGALFEDYTKGANNTAILGGTTTSPSGDFFIHYAGARTNYFGTGLLKTDGSIRVGTAASYDIEVRRAATQANIGVLSDLNSGQASFIAQNTESGATTQMASFGSTASSTRFGINRTGMSLVQLTPNLSSVGALGTFNNTSLVIGTNNTERLRVKNTGVINIVSLSEYADNAAALAGGLVAGDVYKTATGTLMIVY